MTLIEKVKALPGYNFIKELNDGRVAAIHQLLYTYAILTFTEESVEWGYTDRWCYLDISAAATALHEWDGTGEPKGWHRHPMSGRRRDEQGKEYINK